MTLCNVVKILGHRSLPLRYEEDPSHGITICSFSWAGHMDSLSHASSVKLCKDSDPRPGPPGKNSQLYFLLLSRCIRFKRAFDLVQIGFWFMRTPVFWYFC